MSLPHQFPFRWIDATRAGVALVEITANATWLRGGTLLATPFVAEIVAQAAAMLLEPPEAAARERWMAGIERLELSRPISAGDLLEVSVSPGRRFGNTLRVEGTISRAGEPVATAILLLV